jgi:hypothetical protein
MKNMRMNAEEKKDFHSAPSVIDDKPEYPYGLTITLSPESMEKLGIDAKSLKIGQAFKVLAEAKVKEIREVNENGDVQEHSIELQICEMEVAKEEEQKSADQFYQG